MLADSPLLSPGGTLFESVTGLPATATAAATALPTHAHKPPAAVTSSSAAAASTAAHPSPHSPIDFLTHNVDDEPPLHEHTTSVTRSYSDLHQGAFLGYAFGLCALRTALQQPMNLALARKQTSAAANKLSTWAVLAQIYAKEGRWRGLTHGMAALSLGCALSEVIYLCLFEWGREQLPVESTITRDAVSGYVADVACRTVHIPLSIIAFRQMTAGCGSTTAWSTLRRMYAERGMRTVFAGFGTTLVVGCQWTALWWSLYGQMKDRLYSTVGPSLQQLAAEQKQTANGSGKHQKTGAGSGGDWRLPEWCTSKEDNLIINSVASITTSAATAVLFNPYLVIRTNLQVTPGATLWSVTRSLYRTRGLRGFYSGLLLSVNACVLDGALASTSYEYAKLWSDRTRGG